MLIALVPVIGHMEIIFVRFVARILNQLICPARFLRDHFRHRFCVKQKSEGEVVFLVLIERLKCTRTICVRHVYGVWSICQA